MSGDGLAPAATPCPTPNWPLFCSPLPSVAVAVEGRPAGSSDRTNSGLWVWSRGAASGPFSARKRYASSITTGSLKVGESRGIAGFLLRGLTLSRPSAGKTSLKPAASTQAKAWPSSSVGGSSTSTSRSLPHASNDNPCSESQFKTLKNHPDFHHFESFDHALSDSRRLID